jgi:hypothetical protein
MTTCAIIYDAVYKYSEMPKGKTMVCSIKKKKILRVVLEIWTALIFVLIIGVPSGIATSGFLAKWGSPGSGDSQFGGPYGLAVDSSGNIYVADMNNNRIQKFGSM